MIQTLALGMALAVPVIWAAFGELLIEKSGVLNIGVEGVMLVGAFGAAYGYSTTGSLLGGLAAGAIAGALCGVGLAIFYVHLGTNQIVTGIVFNLLALGLTSVLNEKVAPSGALDTFGDVRIPGLASLPWIGPVVFDQSFLFYAALVAAPIVFWVVQRTWFGLSIRAVSEHPAAAAAAGLNVRHLRDVALLAGCALTGFGGAVLVVTTSGGFSDNMTEGRGFIALALVVLARWNPGWVVVTCAVFGFAQALQFQSNALGPVGDLPSDVVLMLPYIVTILAVTLSRRSRYPAACGIPYLARS